MKKLFIAIVAVAALVAFAVPAMAAGSIHVRALLDFGYKSTSEDRTVSGDTVTGAFMQVPGHSYLRGLWMSDDKKVGAHAELGINSAAFNGTGTTLRYLYGWYKVGNCKFVAGHTDSTFGSLAYHIPQYVGFGDMKLLLIDWGFVYSGRHPSLRFEWNSGAFGFSISAVAPPTAMVSPGAVATGLSAVAVDATGALVPGGAITAPVGRDVYTLFPMMDVVVSFKAGGFMTTPGFRWAQMKSKYPAGAPNYPDTISAWMFQLPVKFTAGAFSVVGQVFYGQNTSYITAALAGATSVAGLNASMTDVENTTSYGGSIGATFTTGALKVMAGAGYVRNSNDLWSGAVNDYTSRMAFILGARYSVTKNFYINPEVSYWHYGDSTAGTSLGTEWLLGVQFGFVF